MAQIYNSELTDELKIGAKIQLSRDRIPNEIAEKVVPTMEVNPKLLKNCNILRHATAINTTATTVYSVPSDIDFYLCGCSLSVIKDATATSINSAIQITVDGDSNFFRPISIAGLTLTPQSLSESVDFNRPIKVKRGTNISVINSTNVANCTSSACIWGYTVHNANS